MLVPLITLVVLAWLGLASAVEAAEPLVVSVWGGNWREPGPVLVVLDVAFDPHEPTPPSSRQPKAIAARFPSPTAMGAW